LYTNNSHIQRLLYIPGMAITGTLIGVVGGLVAAPEDMAVRAVRDIFGVEEVVAVL
jgi:hypothetical protein